ncbi:hypothetical protein DFH09DRAFT_1125317, partial [Mycena vulgaris]
MSGSERPLTIALRCNTAEMMEACLGFRHKWQDVVILLDLPIYKTLNNHPGPFPKLRKLRVSCTSPRAGISPPASGWTADAPLLRHAVVDPCSFVTLPLPQLTSLDVLSDGPGVMGLLRRCSGLLYCSVRRWGVRHPANNPPLSLRSLRSFATDNSRVLEHLTLPALEELRLPDGLEGFSRCKDLFSRSNFELRRLCIDFDRSDDAGVLPSYSELFPNLAELELITYGTGGILESVVQLLCRPGVFPELVHIHIVDRGEEDIVDWTHLLEMLRHRGTHGSSFRSFRLSLYSGKAPAQPRRAHRAVADSWLEKIGEFAETCGVAFVIDDAVHGDDLRRSGTCLNTGAVYDTFKPSLAMLPFLRRDAIPAIMIFGPAWNTRHIS